ncbi:RNA-directed DNA polymerase from mobile element jockey [Plakobranchus ocellatus]|uniref:RNA-directed DNA polymerase from mobile element jockey n=1 Tax=Plakobranchus ocellatus TaxID=259542 RepID=A0AAV3YU32_9GAST|nr:RNA-directed DNA polymerase from mobile element jockey [Plakobranchus ocellatus]
MSELINSIAKSNESAAGPDGVYYQFLRHLPESCLHTFPTIFNIWTTGAILPSWREATVVPIPKPGKDPSDPSNYRPTALTSCLCKTLERMVNDRLVHVLESRNLLSNVQCGFRKDHSTLDHLVRLETFIARKK